MFLDHYKPAYTTDLKLCEELKLVTPGSVLAADNVIKPGNPPYLEYVRSNVQEKRKKAQEGGTGGSVEGFAERNVKQYAKRHETEKFSQSAGNPNLVYESRLVNSYEPTGVPVSLLILRWDFELTFLPGRCRDNAMCWRGEVGQRALNRTQSLNQRATCNQFTHKT